MSIQSFTEHLLSTIEKSFEREANNLLNDARQRTGNEAYIAGKMDGLSDSVRMAKEVYAMFVKPDEEPGDTDAKALY